MLRWVTVLALCLALLTPDFGDAANPGLQLVITSKGLKYVADVGIPMLEKELSSLTIPPVSGRASTPLGDIDYDLTNIKLGKLSIPTYSLTTGSAGLELKCSGISVSASADWHYREVSWPHISDSGSADLSISSSSLSLSVKLGRNSSDGHMTLTTSGCSLSIGHLSIHFNGGASWLYNLFDDQIADSLKGSLSSTICDTAVKYIDTSGNAAVDSIPLVTRIDSTAEINYELLTDPAFTSAYLQTQHKGEFYFIANRTEAPFDTPPVPDGSSIDGSKMMYIWVTTYVPNSAGYVYQQSGKLHYTFTQNSTLPPGIELNTNFFGAFIPALSKMYPNMPMQLALAVGKYPLCVTDNNTVYLSVPGSMEAYVQLSNGTLVPVFTLALTLYTTGDVYVNNTKSGGVMGFVDEFLRIDINLTSSNIGPFNVAVLQKTLDVLAMYFLVPEINAYSNKGIPIPTVEGVTLVDPSITVGKDYILISTDVSYTPTVWGP